MAGFQMEYILSHSRWLTINSASREVTEDWYTSLALIQSHLKIYFLMMNQTMLEAW